MSEILSALQLVVAVLGGWVLVSLVTTAALLPVFRAMSRLNALEKLRAQGSDDWAMKPIRIR